MGEGKLVLVKKFVEMANYEFQNSFFYSDSINDLPLLSAVGYPIAINPDEKLMSVSNLKVGEYLKTSFGLSFQNF